MKGILNGLNNVWEMLVMFKDFLVNQIKSLFELIKILTSTTSTIQNMIQTLPPYIYAVASLTLGVCIIYLIVGRSAGK